MKRAGLSHIWTAVAACWFVVAVIWIMLGNPLIGALCVTVAVLSSLAAYSFARRS